MGFFTSCIFGNSKERAYEGQQTRIQLQTLPLSHESVAITLYG